jgi:hypothetical protein
MGQRSPSSNIHIHSQHQEKHSMSDIYDDDLFEPAKSEFPAKEDLKDRLVAIYPTGKVGTRKSQATNKEYGWVETTTVVLDDGPDGTSVTDLVGPAPQVLRNFQWSAAGIFSRVEQKRTNPSVPGTVGRINSMKNKIKGMADAWSISTPTEDEMAIARQFGAECRAARDEIKAARAKDADEDAFG